MASPTRRNVVVLCLVGMGMFVFLYFTLPPSPSTSRLIEATAPTVVSSLPQLPVDESALLFDRVSSLPPKLLLVMVHVAKLERLRTMENTWKRVLDRFPTQVKFITFSSSIQEVDYFIDGGRDLKVARGSPNRMNRKKALHMWRDIVLGEFGNEYKYVYKLDDDCFVFVENLFHLLLKLEDDCLNSINSVCPPDYYTGYFWKSEDQGLARGVWFASGGPGWVISSTSLSKIQKKFLSGDEQTALHPKPLHPFIETQAPVSDDVLFGYWRQLSDVPFVGTDAFFIEEPDGLLVKMLGLKDWIGEHHRVLEWPEHTFVAFHHLRNICDFFDSRFPRYFGILEQECAQKEEETRTKTSVSEPLAASSIGIETIAEKHSFRRKANAFEWYLQYKKDLFSKKDEMGNLIWGTLVAYSLGEVVIVHPSIKVTTTLCSSSEDPFWVVVDRASEEVMCVGSRRSSFTGFFVLFRMFHLKLSGLDDWNSSGSLIQVLKDISKEWGGESEDAMIRWID